MPLKCDICLIPKLLNVYLWGSMQIYMPYMELLPSPKMYFSSVCMYGKYMHLTQK